MLVFVHDAQAGSANVWLGGAFVLGSAVFYSLYLLLSGELVRRVGSLRLVSYVMCVSTVRCSSAKNSEDCISCKREMVRGNSWAKGPSV